MKAFVLRNSFPSLFILLVQHWQHTTFQFALNYLAAAESAKLSCSGLCGDALWILLLFREDTRQTRLPSRAWRNHAICPLIY